MFKKSIAIPSSQPKCAVESTAVVVVFFNLERIINKGHSHSLTVEFLKKFTLKENLISLLKNQVSLAIKRR